MPILPFPIEDRYYRYSKYLRQTFGGRVYRISLDAGFTCPTRDGRLGTGGCLYCNNASFSADRSRSLKPIKDQLAEGIDRAQKFRKAGKFLAYFQAYTNTYGSVKYLEKLYRSVLDVPNVVGILIGTRPDCINDDIFTLLKDLNQDTYVSVEYGIESVYDKTLGWAQRGHDFETTRRAIEQTYEHGLHVTGHIIFGFPTETRDEILQSAAILNNLELDALKIHHLHVVKQTVLADLFSQSPFPLFTEQEWIELVCDFLERLRPDIVIQRLVGDAKPGTLIAPKWKTGKAVLLSKIQMELASRGAFQGYRFTDDESQSREI
ncbi:MAG: TIGR01212 family radical SAM protein [Candidatus Marinimicrobia bacterium]|nr:TIGR01212 family radical SAM protein [Candidatus Neomarinimicrobiota bacterium]